MRFGSTFGTRNGEKWGEGRIMYYKLWYFWKSVRYLMELNHLLISKIVQIPRSLDLL